MSYVYKLLDKNVRRGNLDLMKISVNLEKNNNIFSTSATSFYRTMIFSKLQK